MAIRKPLVLDSSAEIQQLQNVDTIVVPSLQQQIDGLKILIAKLVMNQISIGLPIKDPELLELLNEINL